MKSLWDLPISTISLTIHNEHAKNVDNETSDIFSYHTPINGNLKWMILIVSLVKYKIVSTAWLRRINGYLGDDKYKIHGYLFMETKHFGFLMKSLGKPTYSRPLLSQMYDYLVLMFFPYGLSMGWHFPIGSMYAISNSDHFKFSKKFEIKIEKKKKRKVKESHLT